MNPTPTTEERIWAVLSHLSALAFGMGMMLPVIGWSEQRRKSNYASFHCLQALGYQSLGYTIWLLTYIVVIILLMIIFVFAASRAENGSAWVTASTSVFLFIIFGLLGVYMIFPVIAAAACVLGRDFQYPILGRRLAEYLGYERPRDMEDPVGLNEEHEDRWVASMGHFSVIIPLWGLIAPVTTWIAQGRRSAFLKFQSIQTAIYQGIINLIYLGAIFVYLLGFLIMLAVLGLGFSSGMDPSLGILGMIPVLLMFFIAALILLALPLFHILGQWAGYRTLKGDNYHYPWLGRWVETRMNKQAPLAGDGGLIVQGEPS